MDAEPRTRRSAAARRRCWFHCSPRARRSTTRPTPSRPPDPVEAQRLLDELASEGTPLAFTIVTPGGDAGTKAIAVQTQLSQFDELEVSVRQLDGPTYGTVLFAGDFDLAAFTVGGTYRTGGGRPPLEPARGHRLDGQPRRRPSGAGRP